MALLTQGFIKVQLGAGSGPIVYTTIPGGLDVNGGGLSPNDIDSTDFDTPPGSRESIPGPRENNPYTMTFHYQPGDTQQEALFTAENDNTPVPFRITLGAGGSGGELLDLMSAGEIKAADVEAAPMAAYPLAACLKALWATWDLAQYGPQGRQADDGGENPPRSARPTWSRRTFGRLFGRG